MYVKYFFLIILQITLISCSASKIKNFEQYSNAPILKNTIVTDNFEEDDDKIKVVVLTFSENDIAQAKSAKAGINLAKNVEKTLTTDKLVEILDRSAFKKLNDEIILAEVNNQTVEYSGPENADYAISGTITNAHLTSVFEEGKSYFDFKNSVYVKIPPQIKYEANVSGNLKIYQLPNLKVVANFSFSGNKYLKEDAPKTGSFFKREVDLSHLKESDAGLLNDAGNIAIRNLKSDLKSFFSNLDHAYIFAKKSYKSHNIFQISMGKNDGLKQGQKIDLYKIQEINNELTGKTTQEEIQIGSAIVSDKIYSDSAWIIVKEQELADSLEIGDFAKRNFDKSLLEKLDSFSQSANEFMY